MVSWWFGIRLGVPQSNNPFHKGIPKPNQQFTIRWVSIDQWISDISHTIHGTDIYIYLPTFG